MKPKESGIVEMLEKKYQTGLAGLGEVMENKSVQVGPQNNADISFLKKWGRRVGEGWYGFDLGNIPDVWQDVLDDFLVWLESRCPDFEIRQIKMKLGGLRFYIKTNTKDAAINEKVRSEIYWLEKLLCHEKYCQP